MGRVSTGVSFESEEQRQKFLSQATKLGYERQSDLFRAIANEEFLPKVCPAPQGNLLIAMANALLEKGDRESLVALAQWARDFPGLPPAVVEELERLTGIQNEWVRQVEALIKKCQPFTISTPRNIYHCRYADFWTAKEGMQRQQLRVWCDVPSDGELVQLSLNRSFKLTRADVEVSPLNEAWRYQGLDTIEVMLRLSGGLAKNYQPREDDLELSVDGVSLLVKKQVWSSWWLLETVRRYGESCVVVSPHVLREKVRESALRVSQLHS